MVVQVCAGTSGNHYAHIIWLYAGSQSNSKDPVQPGNDLAPGLAAILAGVDRAIGEAGEHHVGMLRVEVDARDHVRIVSGDAVGHACPGFAVILASQQSCMSATCLPKQVAAPARGGEGACTGGLGASPGGRTVVSHAHEEAIRPVRMDGHDDRVSTLEAVFEALPVLPTVVRAESAEAGGGIHTFEAFGAANQPVNIAIHSIRQVARRLVGLDPGWIVHRWEGSRAEWPADIQPRPATVAALDGAALLDADYQFVRRARIQCHAADIWGMRRRREGPVDVVWQVAEGSELAEGAAAVFRDVDHRRQGAHIDLVGPRGMHGHRPDLAVIEATSRIPLPRVAAVLAAVHVRDAGGVDVARVERIDQDRAHVLALEVSRHHLGLATTRVEAALDHTAPGEEMQVDYAASDGHGFHSLQIPCERK